MSGINKLLAILMLPVGTYIILEELKIYALNLPVNSLLIGAILMVLLQVLNLVLASANQSGGEETGGVKPITILTSIFFILPAAAYFLSLVMIIPLKEYIPMFLGVLMIAESLYALH
ncbi:MAG: hypothetical protein ABIH82_05405 [Candidatus Woesearchaeota archaeon]